MRRPLEFDEISEINYLVASKKVWRFCHIFVAFSEYMDFRILKQALIKTRPAVQCIDFNFVGPPLVQSQVEDVSIFYKNNALISFVN